MRHRPKQSPQPHKQLFLCNTLKVVSDMSAYHDLPVKYRYAINKEKEKVP